eukprot:2565410-Prymnesium_polylepis.1
MLEGDSDVALRANATRAIKNLKLHEGDSKKDAKRAKRAAQKHAEKRKAQAKRLAKRASLSGSGGTPASLGLQMAADARQRARASAQEELRRDQASRLLQRAARARRERQLEGAERARRETAARTVGRLWRGHMTRRTIRSIVRAEVEARANRLQNLRRNRAAAKLQAAVRGDSLRRWLAARLDERRAKGATDAVAAGAAHGGTPRVRW